MATRAAIRCLGIAVASLLALPISTAAQEEAVSVAGIYDGSQTEMAARLDLGADGRYRYALSYGAVDEFSTGTWTRREGGIVLNSDPSTPPQFELLGTEQGTAAPGKVRVHLEGIGTLPLALFSVSVERGDGTSAMADFSQADIEIPVSPDDGVLSISLALPMYEIGGEPVTVSRPEGKALYFAFHANDLGFKAFDNEPLFESDGMLLLERFGREIVFRKVTD